MDLYGFLRKVVFYIFVCPILTIFTPLDLNSRRVSIFFLHFPPFPLKTPLRKAANLICLPKSCKQIATIFLPKSIRLLLCGVPVHEVQTVGAWWSSCSQSWCGAELRRAADADTTAKLWRNFGIQLVFIPSFSIQCSIFDRPYYRTTTTLTNHEPS